MGVFPSKPPTEYTRIVSKSPNELQVKLGLARSITSVDGPEELAKYPPTTRNLFAVKMILKLTIQLPKYHYHIYVSTGFQKFN